MSRSTIASLLRRAFAPQVAREPRAYRVRNLTRQTELASRGEIASHGASRRKGLLGRKGLNDGEGLWIVPCEAVHTFGMRFAIDLVYLDRRNRVVKTRSAVPPGRMSACLSAHSVLELPAGTVMFSETQRGDQLELCVASEWEFAAPRRAPNRMTPELS